MQIQNGPNWTDGTAAGTGEDAEQFFSMYSSLSSTTKNMSAVRSTEVLTDAAASWAANKRESQPIQLHKRKASIC
jgi:uncharacterized membrane protein